MKTKKLSPKQQSVVDALNSHPLAFLLSNRTFYGGEKYSVFYGDLHGIKSETIDVLKKAGLIRRGMLSPAQIDAYRKDRPNDRAYPREAFQLPERIHRFTPEEIAERKRKDEIAAREYRITVAIESVAAAIHDIPNAFDGPPSRTVSECLTSLGSVRAELESLKTAFEEMTATIKGSEG